MDTYYDYFDKVTTEAPEKILRTLLPSEDENILNQKFSFQ